jgi:hypothetical protein
MTDRDRAIVREVARHRVLTASQVADLFFDSRHRALMRLRTLAELGVLDRFRLLARPGEPNEYHYVLGRAGAAMAAAAKGQDPEAATRRWRADTALALAAGQRLAHAVGISGFYAALAREARGSGDARLVEWMTEHEAAMWSDRLIRPDGFGVWAECGRSVEFFLEFDRGTETLRRLTSKLVGYEAFEAERGAAAWVLFVFPTAGRDAQARRAMAGSTVPVATAVLGGGTRPHSAVWRPLAAGSDEPPRRLASLADIPIPAEAQARAAAGSTRAWRYDRSRPDDEEEAPIEFS